MAPRGMNICKKTPPKLLSSTFTPSPSHSISFSPPTPPLLPLPVRRRLGARGRRRRRPLELVTAAPRYRGLRARRHPWSSRTHSPPPLEPADSALAAPRVRGLRGILRGVPEEEEERGGRHDRGRGINWRKKSQFLAPAARRPRSAALGSPPIPVSSKKTPTVGRAPPRMVIRRRAGSCAKRCSTMGTATAAKVKPAYDAPRAPVWVSDKRDDRVVAPLQRARPSTVGQRGLRVKQARSPSLPSPAPASSTPRGSIAAVLDMEDPVATSSRRRSSEGEGAAEGAGKGRGGGGSYEGGARRRAQGRRWRRGGSGGGLMEGKMIKLKGIFAYIHAP
ncbi:hypothetical protein PVAP13_3KG228317 [Panicum virgatum]|uniref:Uncharacterized protein n=1 Tax=Panicum virgatum TaxID=38727 RepID=A0A8T0V528_PANVG|nr:hypothetical protein PVAP13_3KG228317 [Panicum virgatum]